VPDKDENVALKDLTTREIGLLVPLAILVLVIGLFPSVLLDKIGPSTEAVLDHIESTTDYTTPYPGRLDYVFTAGGDS
jgi:NADH-quinone oxidoreductase subunit M